MKYLIWIGAAFSLSVSSAYGDENELTTHLQYQSGSPIVMHLDYHGGIGEWDAAASITDGILVLSNAMLIAVTDSSNESIKPLEGKVLSVSADAYFRDPFSLEIDLSEFYDLSRPGRYIVRWGCRNVREDTVYIQIVD